MEIREDIRFRDPLNRMRQVAYGAYPSGFNGEPTLIRRVVESESDLNNMRREREHHEGAYESLNEYRSNFFNFYFFKNIISKNKNQKFRRPL
jgi:hypothetical protein